MWLPTKPQIDAASRHVITAVGVTALINSLGSAVGSLVQVIAAAGVVYGGIKAANSASPTSQIATVRQMATSGSTAPQTADAQKALVEATSAIALDPTLQSNQDAKVALIDATAALPEVVGDIKVADPVLAAATASPQVKPA